MSTERVGLDHVVGTQHFVKSVADAVDLLEHSPLAMTGAAGLAPEFATRPATLGPPSSGLA